MTHSLNKGKQGEREFCELLRGHGFTARRGQQFAGGGDSPDVVSNVPGVHFEVKRTETLQLWPSLDQAARDAAPGNIPCVVHRPSRRPWIVVLQAADFLQLMAELKCFQDLSMKDVP